MWTAEEPVLLAWAGGEVYGHAWVQWWHGLALPGWPSGTDLARGTEVWPVIDPLTTGLAALLGRLVGWTVAWNGVLLGSVALAFVGGAVLARRYDGDPLVGGTVLALGPVFLGSLASGLTEDFSLGLLGGGGVEFFLNSNLAAGLTVQLQRHLMSAVRYTGLHAVAGVTWY